MKVKIERAAEDLSIGHLNLSKRAVTSLRRANVRTIGDLVRQKDLRFRTLKGVRAKIGAEISDTLFALFDAVSRSGVIDWAVFAQSRGLVILPTPETRRWTPVEFVIELPRVVQRMLHVRFQSITSPRWRQQEPMFLAITRDRIFKESNVATTLAELGKQFGVTRQRIRLAENYIFTRCHQVFVEENYEDCGFRVSREYLSPLQLLSRSVDQARRADQIVTLQEWRKTLDVAWGMVPEDLRGSERLLRTIMGIEGRPILHWTQSRLPRKRPARRRSVAPNK